MIIPRMEKYYSVRISIAALWMIKISCIVNIYGLSLRLSIYKILHVYCNIAKKKLHYIRRIITKAIRLYKKPIINFFIHKKQVMIQKYKIFLILAIPIFVGMFFIGCTRKIYVPVESVRTEYKDTDTAALFNSFRAILETTRQKENHSDSVIDKERETVTLNDKGDTVKLIKNHYIYVSSKREKELEHEVEKKDSVIDSLRTQLESVKVDSIPVPYPVERELTRWEKVKMDAGGFAIGAGTALLVAVIALLVWIFKIKRRK